MLKIFPSLTQDEFREACQSLEFECHDRLHNTDWQSIQWHESGELQIQQASRQCDRKRDKGQTEKVDTEDKLEDDDMEAIEVNSKQAGRPIVNFSIVLSATYQVPVLWFAIPSARSIRLSDLNDVYSHVVSSHSHVALRQVGVMGGISIANHPLTDKPMFFLHPCNTSETLAALNDGGDLDPLSYLLLWFGIVGTAVGLHVPSKVIA